MRCILLILSLAVCAVLGGHGYDSDSFSAGQRLALAHPGSCEWVCNDDSGEAVASGATNGAPPERFAECWGVFKFWCKSTPDAPAGATTAKALAASVTPQQGGVTTTTGIESVWFWGVSCRGHFMWAEWEQGLGGGAQADVNGVGQHTLAVCEGGWRALAGSIRTCPHTGSSYKKMRGSFVLGTASLLTSTLKLQPRGGGGGESEGEGEGEGEGATRAQASQPDWVRAVQARARWGDELSAQLQQRRQQAAAAAVHTATSATTSSTSAPQQVSTTGIYPPQGDVSVMVSEGRSDGVGGSWRVTRKLDAGAGPAGDGGDAPVPPATSALDQDAVEAEVEGLLAPSWRDWLPHWHGAGAAKGHGSSSGGGGRGGRGGCGSGEWSLTCNGRDAWWHGEAPCWGNLTLSVKHTPAAPAPTPAAAAASTAGSTTGAVGAQAEQGVAPGRRLRATATTTTASTNPHTIASQAASAAPTTTTTVAASSKAAVREVVRGGGGGGHGGNVTFAMTAECDGLWTGFFGHTCRGLGLVHTAASSDARGWSADEWNICSGGKSIRRIHRRDVAWGSADMCGGKGVSRALLSWVAPTPTPGPAQ
eukprot:CAMPEP_0202857328 /NCGR_PEP_ID=MMETSP1391-20130828/317_1 /ASSEMBLY_ACC=CAM_ASM_000867 /TAXON_ID=1034604 /ORGANISM="Chlamydomonas leiostraca, Strain SAG 11-49" /LENGTH=590 /DNA_ID=CAMNT_0049536119 /DNA_START=12 /DNA_END=1784 /DNA_ORIENTATION=-